MRILSLCMLFFFTSGFYNNIENGFMASEKAFKVTVGKNRSGIFHLYFEIAPGSYLYRDQFIFKTNLSKSTLKILNLPSGEKCHDDIFGDTEIYRKNLDIKLGLSSEEKDFLLTVQYQGCANIGICYPPESVDLHVDSLEDYSPLKKWQWYYLLIAFLAGLSLALNPCTLSLLPIFLTIILQDLSKKKNIAYVILSYTLVSAISFTIIGLSIGLLGARLNLQSYIQSVWVLIPLALFFITIALNILGILELRLGGVVRLFLPSRICQFKKRISFINNTPILGIISSILISPCISPHLSLILVHLSVTKDILGSTIQLLFLNLGMLTPFLLIAIFGNSWLPNKGKWLIAIRYMTGMMFLFLGLYSISRVVPSYLFSLFISFFLISGALVIAVSIFFSKKVSLSPIAARTLSISLLVCILFFCYRNFEELRNFYNILSGKSYKKGETPGDWVSINSIEDLEVVLKNKAIKKQPSMLYVHANWCVSCRIFEHVVLEDFDVISRLNSYKKLSLNITKNTQEQNILLEKYQLFAPPTIIFFDMNGLELFEKRLVGSVNKSYFLSILKNK